MNVAGTPVIIDYKRTSRTPVRKVSEGLAVQLPLYGLAEKTTQQQEEDGDEVLLGYWDVLAGEWRPMNAIPKTSSSVLMGSDLHKPRGKKPLSELVDAAKDQLANVLGEIGEKKHFFLRTDDCTFCEFTTICRVDQNKAEA